MLRSLLHDYPAFRADPLNFWLETGRKGPLVRVRFGPAREYLVVTDADLFQLIFQTRARSYPRDREIRDGNGVDPSRTVFNAPTYDEWLWRRRLLQPSFHARRLAKFGDAIVAESERLVTEAPDGAVVELVSLMKTLTIRIICRTMFSATLAETEALQHGFEQTSSFSYRQLSALVKIPGWLPLPSVRKTKASVQTMQAIIGDIVQDRLSSGKPRDDMLDMLISAHLDEDGRRFSGEDLVSEMKSIIFAGHETTAMTLVWLFYVLSQRPDIEQKLRAEIATVLGERRVTLADLDAMPYTECVIKETLRFYPAVYVTLREAEQDDRLGDVNVPAGTRLVMNIRGLHRDPRYWDAPDQFQPERFAPAADADRHKFAFMPFIEGPKKCIGGAFAMMEMQLVVPTLLQAFRFQFAGQTPPVERAGFVMETAAPLPMRLARTRPVAVQAG